jgi:hypothetical protein
MTLSSGLVVGSLAACDISLNGGIGLSRLERQNLRLTGILYRDKCPQDRLHVTGAT